MNPNIKDKNKIYVGQKINYLSGSPLPEKMLKPKEERIKRVSEENQNYMERFSSKAWEQYRNQKEKVKSVAKTKTLAYGKKPIKKVLLESAGVFSFDNLKNAAKQVVGRVFGDRDFITGRTPEEEKLYQQMYNTPYNAEMDKGEPLIYRHRDALGYIPDSIANNPKYYNKDGSLAVSSQLGDLGLYGKHVDGSGRTCYYIKNDKGEVVSQCAETGNLIARKLGVPTTDNAWTRRGVYGDSLIYGPSDHNHFYSRYVGKLVNSYTPSLLDPNNLKSGDIVDLYTEGSGHNAEAAKGKGRGNSHTGTIFKPYSYKNSPAYIIHNINKDVYVDPLSRFGPLHTWAIMGVRRPGSKEKPYYND